MAEGAKRELGRPEEDVAALHGGQPVDTVIGKIGFRQEGRHHPSRLHRLHLKKGADGKIGYVEN